MARMYGSQGEEMPLFRINLGRMSGPTFSEEGNLEHQPVVFSGHFKVQTPCRGMGVEKKRKISANPVLPKGEGVDIISFVCTSKGGHSSAGRALASQAKGRGFESRCPLQFFPFHAFYFLNSRKICDIIRSLTQNSQSIRIIRVCDELGVFRL